MKTNLLLITGLFLSTSFQASALPGLKCITGGFPTTSFVLTEKPTEMELLVVHHNGVKYAPVYNGVVTPNDVDMIVKSGAFFAKLGDRFTLHLKKDKCRLDEGKFFTCSHKYTEKVSDQQIDSVYFTTTETVDRIPEMEFVHTNVRLHLGQGSEDYLLDMTYQDNDCQIVN